VERLNARGSNFPDARNGTGSPRLFRPMHNCPISTPRYGAFFCFTPQCQIAQKCDGVGLHESTSQATQKESWPRKLEQGDKWSFCLVATTIVNKRRTLFHAETQSLSKRDSYAGLEQTGTLEFSTLSAFQNAMCRRSAASLLRGGAAS
jgi:hypothetical protein